MQTNEMLRVDGVVVFWSLGEWTDLAALKDGLELCGRLSFAPVERTPIAALRDALGATFPRHLVEPLKKKDSFEVREIVRGEEENDYRHCYRVNFREDDYVISLAPFEQQTANILTDNFNRFLGLVRAATVTGTLTAILKDLRGISLRGRGSVYWLPGDALEEWTEVCGAVERASALGGKNACYLIKHQMDADALRAVQDAIVNEVIAEVARIQAEIESGELGERALETRKAEAIELRDKVTMFEGILGLGLDSLRGKVDELETSAAAAAMLASLSGEVA